MYSIRQIRHFVTDNSITLFWEKPERVLKEACYRVLVDEEPVGETDKTHYTIENLKQNQEYDIRIEVIAGYNILAHKECGIICTAKTKNKIDVTKAPYNAVGDGATLNTEKLQQAIDTCDGKSVVYFPAGTYMTGALRLHSDMEVYLEEGAVLQGTDNPEASQ